MLQPTWALDGRQSMKSSLSVSIGNPGQSGEYSILLSFVVFFVYFVVLPFVLDRVVRAISSSGFTFSNQQLTVPILHYHIFLGVWSHPVVS